MDAQIYRCLIADVTNEDTQRSLDLSAHGRAAHGGIKLRFCRLFLVIPSEVEESLSVDCSGGYAGRRYEFSRASGPPLQTEEWTRSFTFTS
jgi:hypothetical protein